MAEEIPDGENPSKMVNGKMHHWCKKHEAWGRHLPSDCQGKGHMPSKEKKTEEPPRKKSAKSKSDEAKVAKALVALQDDDSDTDQEE